MLWSRLPKRMAFDQKFESLVRSWKDICPNTISVLKTHDFFYLVDMVQAELMLVHNIVVIQARRLHGDQETVLQQLALACFQYHLLTTRISSTQTSINV